jgi:two-component system, NtrC family, response regulator AtoC
MTEHRLMGKTFSFDATWKEPTGTLPPADLLFGRSEKLKEIRGRIEKVAGSDLPILIRGESGTGKEIFAKYIHACSLRSSGPFIKVHCPAIPGTLLESELFGYEAGSFTGAWRSKPGRVEVAHGGSLFLDEIGDLDSSLQVKLLHVLQDRQVARIGGQEAKTVDVRVICATHCALEEEIEKGRFRSDLFFRINVVTLHLPPLRERRDDIPQLAAYFLGLYEAKYNRQAPPMSDACVLRLQEYDWPGNIRELENVMNSYVVLGPEENLMAELEAKQTMDISGAKEGAGTISLRKIARQAAREAERRTILRILEANRGNRRKAAQALNMSYRALLYRIKEVGIPPKRAQGKVDAVFAN